MRRGSPSVVQQLQEAVVKLRNLFDFVQTTAARAEAPADLPETRRLGVRGTAHVFKRTQVHAGIREAAKNKTQVRLTYTKRNGETVTRYVSPYSYRGHLFYGKHEHTKSFVTANIHDVTVTIRPAHPDYPVEISA